MKKNNSVKAGKCKMFIGGVKALIAAVAIALAGTAQASYTCVWSGITWTYDLVGSKAKIIEASPVSGLLVIPSKLDGHDVKSIAQYAFSDNSNLQRLIIESGLTSIGISAFENCTSLKSVVLPDTVTTIGEAAFDGCIALKNSSSDNPESTCFVLPEGVASIGNFAFSGCTSLESVVLPDTVVTIGDSAFYGCSALKNSSENSESTYFTLPEGVASIGEFAFSGCTVLRNVVLPSSLTSLGAEAFSGCDSLRYVSLPFVSAAFVDDISDNYVFAGCPDSLLLTFREVVDGVEWSFRIVDGEAEVYNDDEAAIFDTTAGDITIPDTLGGKPVTRVGDWAFDDCSALTSVTIPETVTSIGESAFADCSGLKNVNVPNAVTSVGASAFYGCSVLESMTIPDGVTVIEDWTFSGCVALTEMSIPYGVTSIGESAFEDCSGLVDLAVPETVKTIGESAFSGCTSLESLILYEGLESIGDYAFSGCMSLTSAHVPDSVTTLGKSEFADCTSLETVTIGKGVKSIGEHMFRDCTALTYVGLPEGLESIGYGAFSDCEALTKITLPESVTEIWDSAFIGCGKLKYVSLPPALSSIKDYTFNACSSLADLTIPAGVKDIGSYAFHGCSSLTDLTIPGAVGAIGSLAFSDCTALANVTFEYGVASIGDDVFNGCAKLATVSLPKSVEYVGDYAFGDGTTLTKVSVSSGDTDRMKKLLDDSFHDTSGIEFVEQAYETWTDADGVRWCYRLVDGEAEIYNDGRHSAIPEKTAGAIVVPSTLGGCPVTRIGDAAFSKCTAVTDVTIPTTVTDIGKRAFYKCVALKNVPIPSSVTSIENGAFWGCESLADPNGFVVVRKVLHYYAGSAAEVTIPDGVTVIGNGAFNNHVALTSVIVPSGVAEIGQNAFSGCAALATAKIPATVKTIGQYAFEETALATVYVEKGDTARVSGLIAGSEFDVSKVTFVEEGDAYVDPDPDADKWRTTKAEAVAAALKTGKKIFLVCGHDGCWNTMTTKNVSCEEPAVKAALIAKCVLWYSNCNTQWEENDCYMRGLGSFTLPLVCIIDPKDPDNYVKRVTGTDYGGPLSGADVLAFIADVPDPVAPAPVTPAPVTPAPVNPGPVNPDGPCYVSLDAGAITAPYAVGKKPVTLRGAVYEGCDAVGVVELKLGKVNVKKRISKVSGSVTLVDGKRYTIKSKPVLVNGVSPVTVALEVKKVGTMTVTIGGEEFAGTLGRWHVQTAAVGGNWRSSAVTASVDVGDTSAFPGQVVDILLPEDEKGSSTGAKWKFPKAASVKWTKVKPGVVPVVLDGETGKGLVVDTSKGKTNLSAMKLNYTAKKGTFKGSFKVYALQGVGKGRKLKKYTVKVSGVVVDGIGYGTATCKRPALTWSMTVK